MECVIVIGAGASGIAAASRLIENGLNPKNITILEAQNRIGGRIHTIVEGEHPLELGAQWVHGEEGNIVFELASNAGELNTNLHSLESSGFAENVVFGFENYKLTKDQVKELMLLIESIKENSKSDLSRETVKNVAISLGQYIEEQFVDKIDKGALPIVERSTALAFLDWYQKLENVIDGSDNWRETCGSGHVHYRECSGNPLVTWKRGTSVLFDILTKNLPKVENGLKFPLADRIYLNKVVSLIEWDSGNSEIKTNLQKKTKVTCKDGSQYQADVVLVTSSLGFLKLNNDTLFTPKLPVYKIRAIQGLGYGTVDKIFLKFSKSWWTSEWGGISLLHRPSNDSAKDVHKHWSNDILGFYTVRSHPNLLIGWVYGEAARKAEQLPEIEVLKTCSTILREYVGADFAYTEPIGVIRSSWFTNPFTAGSYSFRSTKSKEMNVWASDLAQPVYDSGGIPRLFFAGEATHDYFYSTVHGAVESGWREADRISKYCNGFANKAKL